ncbi:precorrin-6A/cobalt-precorrin-6A reductase [Sulfitobacter sp. PS-8MA]|uniref:precorrin-6A/cobalt-precorrin-6A reductase n=1 Tax=Sulfitobacter sp. PS-8MA TaxID=3237707 RepID=UPI0034C69071
MTTSRAFPLNLLLLAGSAEARDLAERLSGAGHRVTTWMTEPPRSPAPMPVPVQLRDPKDSAALRRDMAAYDAVLDLSHSFDAALSRAGFAAATALGLPYMRFERPAWPLNAPSITAAPGVAEAARAIPMGARVFAATGWASLPDFLPFQGSRLMLRQTHRHERPAPYDFVDLVFGDPPFVTEAEIALFRALSVDLLICRNLGGRASRPKVDAAVALGLPIILIDRPARPADAPRVETLDAMIDWVAQL